MTMEAGEGAGGGRALLMPGSSCPGPAWPLVPTGSAGLRKATSLSSGHRTERPDKMIQLQRGESFRSRGERKNGRTQLGHRDRAEVCLDGEEPSPAGSREQGADPCPINTRTASGRTEGRHVWEENVLDRNLQ